MCRKQSRGSPWYGHIKDRVPSSKEYFKVIVVSSSKMRGFYMILLIGYLKLCSGYKVPCNVSRDAGGVLYRVPEFEETGCYYNWSNKTHHVLANQRGKIEEQVVMKTNRTLLLKNCQELIYYSRSCFSEGGPRRGTCNVSCAQNADWVPHANLSHKLNWTLIPIIITLVLLLTSCIMFMFRDRICRNPSCFYTSVKMPEAPERRNSMDFGFPFSTVDRVDSVNLPI
ncbi:uncharacterized protein [Labrus bergylta]|uniref:uncharacterized protein n=1 Tax=Labrus bergylta TaxID=56723 RepID=UPI003314181E